MAAKRKSSPTRVSTIPRPVKARLDKLSRAVARSTPEVRQESYAVAITANTTTPALLISTGLNLVPNGSQEMRLHRIRLSYIYQPGDGLWGMMYGLKGTTATSTKGLYTPSTPYNVSNFLNMPEQSNIKVYKQVNLSGTVKVDSTDTTAHHLVTMDQRFSIPKKLSFDDPNIGMGVVPADQIYYIGGNWSASTLRYVYVTIYYSC